MSIDSDSSPYLRPSYIESLGHDVDEDDVSYYLKYGVSQLETSNDDFRVDISIMKEKLECPPPSGDPTLFATASFDRRKLQQAAIPQHTLEVLDLEHRGPSRRLHGLLIDLFGDRLSMLDLDDVEKLISILGNTAIFDRIDPLEEIRRAHIWELKHPARRKQSHEIHSFLVGWFERSNEKAPPKKIVLSEMETLLREIKISEGEVDPDTLERALNAGNVPAQLQAFARKLAKRGNLRQDRDGRFEVLAVRGRTYYAQELIERDCRPPTADEEQEYREQLDRVLSWERRLEHGNDD